MNYFHFADTLYTLKSTSSQEQQKNIFILLKIPVTEGGGSVNSSISKVFNSFSQVLRAALAYNSILIFTTCDVSYESEYSLHKAVETVLKQRIAVGIREPTVRDSLMPKISK